MSTDSWGGALFTFDRTYGVDGEEFKGKFTCSIFSISLDDSISKRRPKRICKPNMEKKLIFSLRVIILK